jgi:hypothetical protein
MRRFSWLKFNVIKLSIVFLFILFQLYLIFLKNHEALDIDAHPNSRPTKNIEGHYKVGQTFVAKRDNMCRIDLKLGTHGRENDRDIIFQLWQTSPKRTLVVQQDFSASVVNNNQYNPIRFLSIEHSKNQEYYFLLHSPKSTPDNSICAWMNDENIYDEGSLMLNNRHSLGDLVFRVYSKRPVFTEMGRIVRNYSGVFGNKYILIFVVWLFVSVQVLVLYKLLDFVYTLFIRS